MPATKARFSDKFLETLEVPEVGRAIYYDTESDLALRVTPTHKTFFITAHVRGKSVRKTLGVYGAGRNVEWARKQAARLLGELANWKLSGQQGRSPLDAPEETTRGLRLSEAIETYIERQKQRKWVKSRNPEASEAQARRVLENCGSLKKKQFDLITHADCVALHTRLTKNRGPVLANRVLQYLSAVYAVVRGNKESPCKGIDKNVERKRTDFLKPERLGPFLAALEKHANPDFRDFIKLLLSTGRRKSVCYEARWADISFTENTWTIPTSKDGDSETAYLSREARAILERRYANRESSPWVFPSGKRKTSSSGHVENFEDIWYAWLEDSGFPTMGLHTLRHTYISYVALGSKSLVTTMRAAGHKSIASTMRYAHLVSGDEVQKAVDAGEAERKKLAAKAQKLLSA